MDELAKTFESITPMIFDEGWTADTAHNIRCVLESMAGAMPSIINMGYCKETAHGAQVMLHTCAASLVIKLMSGNHPGPALAMTFSRRRNAACRCLRAVLSALLLELKGLFHEK